MTLFWWRQNVFERWQIFLKIVNKQLKKCKQILENWKNLPPLNHYRATAIWNFHFSNETPYIWRQKSVSTRGKIGVWVFWIYYFLRQKSLCRREKIGVWVFFSSFCYLFQYKKWYVEDIILVKEGELVLEFFLFVYCFVKE